MGKSKEHFGHCLLFEFQLNRKAAVAHRNLSTVFGDECLSERQCRLDF